MISVSMVAALSPCLISSVIDFSKESRLHYPDPNHQVNVLEALKYLGKATPNTVKYQQRDKFLDLIGKAVGVSSEAGFISWRPILLTASLFLGPLALKLVDMVCLLSRPICF